MHPLLAVLEKMGVDFDSKEHKSYRFKSDGMMDLVVETWLQNDGLHLSVAHYGEQNGDLMADPEMEFIVCQDILAPISYRNDYLSTNQIARYRNEDGKEMIRPGLIKELNSFAGQWASNIRAQGYSKNLELKLSE